MSFFDRDTNTVFISEALSRYIEVFDTMISFFSEKGIDCRIIQGTKNIWARDFMPIQVNDHYVKFAYKGYGIGYEAYSWLRVKSSCYAELKPLKKTDIVLDGGNCQRYDKWAIITDIVFKHNPQYKKLQLVDKLSRLLESEIVIIPPEPGDDLGHSDGIVRFIPSGLTDDPEVFINDYSVMKQKQFDKYTEKLVKVLSANNIDHVILPHAYHKTPWVSDKKFRELYPDSDDYNPAFGYYINFLQVGKILVIPTFGVEEDEAAFEKIEKNFPDHYIKQIDCSKLSMEGGCTNCVTCNAKL